MLLHGERCCVVCGEFFRGAPEDGKIGSSAAVVVEEKEKEAANKTNRTFQGGTTIPHSPTMRVSPPGGKFFGERASFWWF